MSTLSNELKFKTISIQIRFLSVVKETTSSMSTNLNINTKVYYSVTKLADVSTNFKENTKKRFCNITLFQFLQPYAKNDPFERKNDGRLGGVLFDSLAVRGNLSLGLDIFSRYREWYFRFEGQLTLTSRRKGLFLGRVELRSSP